MCPLFRRSASGIRALPVWCRSAPERQAYVLFRRTFQVTRKPSAARIEVSAFDRYALFLNGREIGRGPALGAGSVRFLDIYEDVKAALRQGDNAVSAIVYSHGPDLRNRIMDTTGCFILRLVADFEGAPSLDVSTDTSWRTAPAQAWRPAREPINRWGVGYPEHFDPAGMPPNWNQPAFDDSGWARAELIPPAGTEWRPRPVPPLSHVNLPPVKLAETSSGNGKITGKVPMAGKTRSRSKGLTLDASKPGSYPMVVFDFGRVVPARPLLKLKAPQAGGQIEVYYGENRRLQPLDTLCLTKGSLEWKTFLPRAFRYLGLALRNAPRPVLLNSVEAEVETFPYGDASTLKSNDKLLAGIFETAGETLASASREYFMDCPGREQALWLGDVDREDAAALVVYGEERIGRHSIDLFSLLQKSDGAVPAVGPLSGDAFIPDFHLLWPGILYRHYQYTGEEEFLEERFTSVSRALSWLERVLDRRDLVPNADRPEWWCFLDWQEALPRSGYNAALNLLALGAFRSGALLAEALGRRDQASRWARFTVQMDLAVKQTFYAKERGLFSDLPPAEGASFSQLANALAVCMGAAGGKEGQKLARRMHKANDLIPVATPYSAYWYADALFTAGLKAEGCEFLRQYWGGMVERGATTFWEMFDAGGADNLAPFGGRDDVVSLCHGWGAGVAELIVRHVLGLQAAEPGFRKVRFAPYVTRGCKVSASLHMPTGWYKIALEKPVKTARLRLDLPDEREIEIVLPKEEVRRLKYGRDTVYVKGGPVVLPPKVEGFSAQAGTINLTASAGRVVIEYST